MDNERTYSEDATENIILRAEVARLESDLYNLISANNKAQNLIVFHEERISELLEEIDKLKGDLEEIAYEQEGKALIPAPSSLIDLLALEQSVGTDLVLL